MYPVVALACKSNSAYAIMRAADVLVYFVRKHWAGNPPAAIDCVRQLHLCARCDDWLHRLTFYTGCKGVADSTILQAWVA